MAALEIKLLGEFQVWRDGELVRSEEWNRQKTRSLLKLLLTKPGYAFSKDEIVEALWPGVAPDSAQHSLRTTVGLLRRALEPELKRGSESRYVLGKRPGYSFDEQADCRVDAWDFEEHRKRAEAALKTENFEAAIEEYRAALDLVRGEYLEEDPYEEWAMQARLVWRERHLSVLSGLAECLALKGNYTEAIGLCERALAIDRFGEEVRRRLMLYRYCAGEQALALQTYRDYARTLKEELGTVPPPDLARLKEMIEARDVPGGDTLRRYPKPRRAVRFPYSLSRTHFAGRDAEYASLVERLRETVTGQGGAVAVEGEAGVGKTRLVEEFLGHAKAKGARVLSGRCYERELGPPLEPVTDALGQTAETGDVVSALSDHREADPGGEWGANPYGVARIYQALTEELVREAERGQALILFLDDVQWADPATLDFIPYLARRIQDRRVLLVFTFRREEAPALSGWLGRLAGRRAVRTVSLDRLAPADLAQIIGRMSSGRFNELSSLTEFLHQHSEGNPFYATEYLRWLIEAGAVEIDSHRRIQALRDDALEEDALPSGVRSLIQARFGSLREEAREIVELASVVGRGFDLTLLGGAAGRDEDEAFDLIEPLLDAGLVVETGPETYYFSHDKLRQVLYEDLVSRRRRKLHLRVARVLEEDGGEPAELAHHYLRARKWEKALEYLTLAAQTAEHAYAWESALQDNTRASEVARELQGFEEKRLGLDLLASRERMLEHMDRLQERRDTIEEMFALATRLGDRRRIADAHTRRIGVLRALSEPEGAASAAQAAISIYQELEDRTGEARVHRELGYVLWTNRDHAGALEANFRALRLHRELNDRRGEAGDGGNIAQVYRSMKDHEEALRWAEEAVSIDRELGDRLGETFKMNIMATIHQERGDLEAALSLHLRALSSVTELRAKNLQIAEHMNCGRLYLLLGNTRAALKHFSAASRLGRELGFGRDEGYALVNVGVALEQMGDTEGAEKAYTKSVGLLGTAYEESGSAEELFGGAEVLTLQGRLLGRLGRTAEAFDAFESAAEAYRG